MGNNLALWNAVEKTDPKHVKQITGKQYQGNSPKPHYLIHKATETFGPCGIGWGFEIISERVEEGAGGEKLHVARVRVWYKWDGEKGVVEHVGGTQFSGTRSSGKAFTDEDAPKKSVTDALVKALSMIGFAGDIFMGRYDDSKYVEGLRREEARVEAVADEPEPPTESEKRLHAKLKGELATDIHTLDELGAWAKKRDNIAAFKDLPADLRTDLQSAMAKLREALAPKGPLRAQLQHSVEAQRAADNPLMGG